MAEVEESWGSGFGAGLEGVFICGPTKEGYGYIRFLEDFDFRIKEGQKIDNEKRESISLSFAV